MQSFIQDPDSLAAPRTLRERRQDGSFILRSAEALAPYGRCVGDWLEHWAVQTPQAIALAERAADGGWREVTWQALRQQVGAVAQALIDMDLPAGRPVVILSDNGIAHAVLALAAMHVGRPCCAVSSAYSRAGTDHGRLRAILAALKPALIFAAHGAAHAAAMQAFDGAVKVVGEHSDHVPGALPFEALTRTLESPSVMARFLAITPDDPAKYLLTSGSTGTPKVVVNTHRMLCANQQMIAQAWRFLAVEKPVLLDWLPWSHTFGGNHNVHLVLRHGGTLYIDDGRPVPGLIERTLRNLRDCQPTLHFNVPRGLDMLLPALEADADLAAQFLSRLRGVFYAGAALPQATWDRLQALARSVRGQPLWLTTSWGSTETAPAVTSAHFWLDRAGCIGVPLPGVELKFVPNADKLELRVRGPSVFPGYRDAPAATAEAFDEEGFYRIGDAGRLVDDDRPERGVLFDGRVAEDFKLATGTWVSVGTLRVRAVSALSPLAQDVVVTGHNRGEVGLLVFLSAVGLGLPLAQRRAQVQAALRALRAEGAGSSSFATRALLLEEPPRLDAGEITDKGYVNQRAVLQHRAEAVVRLHEAAHGEDVVFID
ncbi:feruloyl-CoA synthase [Aquincola tertiaricarbonis]|uniref:Feruloyl-CoA synthase n=1 Tax=Aquincola tertiaricarbonis TaxID=391953 RepID=A0ABY4S8F5_AQUTE|nr:feruloyl-CoA synthase [Aquincola tertiaricarbonis]URI08739.1 feruloyl-CoA synthase [Aquincola tertiaricarbonis]